VHDTVKSFQKLLAAQFEIGKAKELIRMGADLQVIGASGEEVQRVLLAITQIKSKGKLQAQEMLQLQEAGVSAELVYDALGKRLGKTRQELAKLQEAGKIDAATGLEAILEAVRHKTGTSKAGDAALGNNTIDASVRRLRADISNTFIDIGEAILPTLEHLTARIPELFRAIKDDPAVASLGDFLLNQFEGFALWVDAHWPEIKETVLGAVHAIDAVLRAQFDVLQFFTDNWDGVKIALYAVAVPLGIVAAGAAILLAPIYGLTYAAVELVIAFIKAADAISESWGKIKGSVAGAVTGALEYLASLPEQFMEMGLNMADGLIEGFESKVESIIESVTGMGERAIEALRNIWRSHSPAEAFADVGEDAGAGTAIGLDRSVAVVESASTRLGRASLQSVANENAAGGGKLGGGSLELHFHAEIMPGATEDDGRRFAEGMRPVIRREVQAIFEGEAA
jgi:tape measure domain-containing protein